MEVKKSDLKLWYETMTIAEVMKKLNIPYAPRLYRLLKEAGIPLKGKQARTTEITLVD